MDVLAEHFLDSEQEKLSIFGCFDLKRRHACPGDGGSGQPDSVEDGLFGQSRMLRRSKMFANASVFGTYLAGIEAE